MRDFRPILGNAARKDQFFPRPKIRKDILEALELNQNLLISSPRRVGKTSVLLNLIDEPDDRFYTVYINTESIDNSDKFFQCILSEVFNLDHLDQFEKFGKETRQLFKMWGERIASIKIAGNGIDLRPGEKDSSFDQLKQFLAEVNLEGKQIVLLLDEFPVTLENIFKKEGKEAAAFFLNQNRELRQNPAYQQKIRFVYTGSIGLINVAKRLDATDRVNDLTEIKVGPLKTDEARIFIELLYGYWLKRNPEPGEVDQIMQAIGIYFPYYFQLLVKEMADLDGDGQMDHLVPNAFQQLIANGNIHLQHYKSRLAKIFDTAEQRFASSLLLQIKASGGMQRNEILNLAEGAGLREQWEDIIDTLFHDGYLMEREGRVVFYSVILQNWWK